MNLTPHQQENLDKAISGGSIGILGGSPGTGKTHVAATYIKQLESRGFDVGVATPTGKASVRMNESLVGFGLHARAMTAHRMLQVELVDEGGWRFYHGPQNPLPYSHIVLDESSMIDSFMFESILSAIPAGCKVVGVGDVNQLPPVGSGAPLRDMISAGVPYGELREIKRIENGVVEGIAQACADIRDGKPFQCQGNLSIRQETDPDAQIEAIFDYLDHVRSEGGDPVWDCQILVAVNKKSPLSRKVINERLQNHLNTHPAENYTAFRPKDKVVCLRNGLFHFLGPHGEDVPLDLHGRCYVANGEIGQIASLRPGIMEVDLTSPARRVRVPLGKRDDDGGNGCDWDLAYALSVHKSQGSEWPYVAVLLDEYPGARRVCDRSWLYTGISRAKSKCHLIGSLNTAHQMCRKNTIHQRKTFLEESIRSYMGVNA